jgi:hypothetical protein
MYDIKSYRRPPVHHRYRREWDLGLGQARHTLRRHDHPFFSTTRLDLFNSASLVTSPVPCPNTYSLQTNLPSNYIIAAYVSGETLPEGV